MSKVGAMGECRSCLKRCRIRAKHMCGPCYLLDWRENHPESAEKESERNKHAARECAARARAAQKARPKDAPSAEGDAPNVRLVAFGVLVDAITDGTDWERMDVLQHIWDMRLREPRREDMLEIRKEMQNEELFKVLAEVRDCLGVSKDAVAPARPAPDSVAQAVDSARCHEPPSESGPTVNATLARLAQLPADHW